MKKKVTLVASAIFLLAAPLVAANGNGFENFTLSRNDFKSNPSSVLANFSSRTRTEDGVILPMFNSKEPHSFVIRIR